MPASTTSLRPHFRTDWADHHVHEHRTGTKIYRHPVVSEIEVTFDAFDMPGEPGLTICTCTVEDNTPSARRMALLTSWAAIQEFGPEHRSAAQRSKTSTHPASGESQ
jgi:hypothetical protein